MDSHFMAPQICFLRGILIFFAENSVETMRHSVCTKLTSSSLSFLFGLQMNTFKDWADCEAPIPIEEQACNIPKVCKLNSRELRKQRYLYTCKECPETYPWIKNEFGMDFK